MFPLIAQPLVALILAAIFAALLVSVIGWRHPRRESSGASFLFVFLLFFPMLWIVALWAVPMGPLIWGAAIAPIVIGGLLLALVIAVLATPRHPASGDAAAPRSESDAAAALYGFTFWLLLVLYAGMIAAGYLL